MYFVFQADNFINNVDRWAEVEGKMPNFLELGEKWHWWSDTPLPVSFPKTTFAILDDILLDRYRTGSIFDLYSEHLIKILRTSDIRCEYFSVNTVTKNKQTQIPIQYYAFHLMETVAAIDYQRSELVDSEILDWFNHKDIVQIVLTDEFVRKQRPLTRDTERPHILFMHESLKDRLIEEGITGCKYIPYQDYRDPRLSDLFTNE